MKKLEFRDGMHEVTDAVAQYLEQFETYQMTYKEAINKMNNRFLEDRVNKIYQTTRNEHLARYRQ